MLNHYPSWKNLLVAVCCWWGLLYALPNLFSQDPGDRDHRDTWRGGRRDAAAEHLVAALERAQITIKSSELKADRLQVRFTAAGRPAGRPGCDLKGLLPPEFTHA